MFDNLLCRKGSPVNGRRKTRECYSNILKGFIERNSVGEVLPTLGPSVADPIPVATVILPSPYVEYLVVDPGQQTARLHNSEMLANLSMVLLHLSESQKSDVSQVIQAYLNCLMMFPHKLQ